MACYERSYSGERRTYGLRVQLTPSEGAELEAAAGLVGAPNLSVYVRELLFRRSAAVVAGTRRDPEAAALMRELNAGGKQPQPDRPTPQRDGDLRDFGELREALALYRQGAERHIAALERVLAL